MASQKTKKVLQAELRQARRKITDLEEERADAVKNALRFSEQNRALSQQLQTEEKLLSNIEKLDEQISESKETIKELIREKSELNQEKKDLSSALDKKQEEANELREIALCVAQQLS